MRILPIALADPSLESDELVTQAHRSSRVTHGAPACLVACALYVVIARELLFGQTDAATALDGSVQRLRETYRRHAEPELADALEVHLAWSERSGRGHVTDSFWSAWDAFAGADDYRSAVVRAVRYGNDTDTTAAIAGGLAGLRFGARSIPTDWLDGLRGRDVVDPLAARLVRRLDASREPALPAMDPDFSFSISDMERIHDNREWERIHRRGGRGGA